MKKSSLPVAGVLTAAVIAAGLGGALASGAIGGRAEEVSDESVFVTPEEQAVTTEAPAVVAEPTPAPVEQPAVEAPAATVEPVTEPAPQAPAAEPETVDPESVGTTGADGHYTPAPPRQNPGEPPVGDFGSTGRLGGGDWTPLPGEPGYVGEVPQPLD